MSLRVGGAGGSVAQAVDRMASEMKRAVRLYDFDISPLFDDRGNGVVGSSNAARIILASMSDSPDSLSELAVIHAIFSVALEIAREREGQTLWPAGVLAAIEVAS